MYRGFLHENFAVSKIILTFATHMTTPILFKEYIWLVETIHKAGKNNAGRVERAVAGDGDERWGDDKPDDVLQTQM